MSESGSAGPRVLVVSHDVLGARVAGPGLRYMELASVLARSCRVTLAGPVVDEVPDHRYRTCALDMDLPEELDPLLAEADVVVSNVCAVPYFPQLTSVGIPWVVDAYIPLATETLAQLEQAEEGERLTEQAAIIDSLNAALSAADLVLCANERQRDLYVGMLGALGRLNAYTYDQDRGFSALIDVVPFGLPSSPPVHRRSVLRGVQPQVAPDDKIVLWGGGIWNWLDPLSLLHALPMVLSTHPRARVFFPGARHPSDRVPTMEMYHRTKSLSNEMGFTDRVVFFGDWIPQQDRGSYLLEANVGVSLHPRGIEPRFALRTRVLDYIWAGLPMVVTEGDSMSDIVRDRGLGYLVRPGDIDGVAQALSSLLDASDDRAARDARFREVATGLTWNQVAEPLIRFCQSPRLAADKRHGYRVPFASARAMDALSDELERSRQREAELENTIRAIKQGRFMRLMAWLARTREATTGKDRQA